MFRLLVYTYEYSTVHWVQYSTLTIGWYNQRTRTVTLLNKAKLFNEVLQET